LFGGVLGGLLVAVLNIGYSRWQAKKSRDQERESLLRLMDAEIDYNLKVLQAFSDSPDGIQNLQTLLMIGTWESSRARLAQLVGVEYLQEVIRLYSSIHAATVMAGDPVASIDEKLDNLKKIVVQAEEARPKVQRMAQRYFSRL